VTAQDTSRHGVSFGEATRIWAQIRLNSFGGPAGQIAVMHRELVERRGGSASAGSCTR
jgi:chromate transporter